MSHSLDTTGLSVNNFISSETHSVSPDLLSSFGCIYLNEGPFFGNNFTVIFTPSSGASVTLALGIDYQFVFELPGFGNTVGTKVWGALELLNTNVTGSLNVSYRALGGNWTFNATAIVDYLSSNMFNGNTQYAALVPSAPLYLPNNPSAIWPINSIQSITIAQAQLPNVDLSIQYFNIIDNIESQTNDTLLSAINLSVTGLQDATGTTGDTSYIGVGYTTIVGVLKGIFNKLGSVLNTRLLTVNDVVSVQGGNSNPVLVNGSGVIQPVSATALPLPTNAAIETGGNLASINSKLPILGQATDALSLPVVLPADQMALLATGTAVALNAGSNMIGVIGDSLLKAVNTLTVTISSAYTTGMCVGGLQTISSAVIVNKNGIIKDIIISGISTQTCTYDVIFFSNVPNTSTFTDKTATVISNTDLPNVLGIVHCTDISNIGVSTVTQNLNASLQYFTAATTLYYAVIVRGTPTYTNVHDLSVMMSLRQN